MGQCATAKLVYGLSFEEGELDHEKLADAFEVKMDPGDDDSDWEVEKAMKADGKGIELVMHSSYEVDHFIIGVGCKRVDWGDAEKIDALPNANAEQVVELARLQKLLGGQLGCWLVAMYG